MLFPRHVFLSLSFYALSLPGLFALNEDFSAPRFGTWGFDPDGRNLDIKPGDDFFGYANGRFVKNAVIPPDRVRFGNFDALSILSEERVHQLLEQAIKTENPETAKIAALYSSYMDVDGINKLGVTPIRDDLEAIRNASDRRDLVILSSKPDSPHKVLFNVGISPDPKEPARYCVSLRSGGLGLPDKSYYFAESFAEIRAKYTDYVATLLKLADWPDAETRAKEMMAFETRLAEVSWDRAELRDRDKTYNPTRPQELADSIDGYPIKDVLTELGLGEVDRLVIGDQSAFPPKAKIFNETSLDTLKAWMAFGVIDQMAEYLSEPFVTAKFEFRSKTLAGQPEAPARWKKAAACANRVLAEEVGKVYVARYFSPESKQKMLDLVSNVREALGVRIEALDWMGADTKKAAQKKLAKFNVKIGYPDKFRDYSAYEVKKDDLVGNIRRFSAFEWQRRVSRLNDPVDRSEWHMPPQRVNAYYNSVLNEIVFPAAILQPPFFDPEADPAVNYGGIGGVIGHEITHGFDDQGRKSDGDGRLQGWWSEEDDKRFSQLAERLGNQYEAVEILPGQRINASLTMGENIADLGGIMLALDAYHASLGGKPAPVIDGLSGEQRVFLSWAQVWRQKIREKALVKQINTDPHSPATARVNFVLRNVDAWYDAFDVKPGDKLYLKPEDRVKIW